MLKTTIFDKTYEYETEYLSNQNKTVYFVYPNGTNRNNPLIGYAPGHVEANDNLLKHHIKATVLENEVIVSAWNLQQML